MTLADKIIMLRKKQGWSQDELAQKLDVTRQSVSKWESAQSVPDVCKIVQISELFGVTTDYLLKDNEEGEDALKNEQTEPVKEKYPESDDNLKKISKEDADEYISLHKEKRGKMALASLLCVLSPICLFIMLAYGSAVSLSESTMGLATMIGIAGILIFVAIAVTMFISADAKTKKFEYIEKDPISLTDEARKLVETEKTAFTSIYTKYNIIGTLCCIFAAIPLLIGSIYGEMVVFLCLCCLLACVAIGVYFFVSAGVLWGAIQRLLEEGEYSRKAKENNKKLEPVAGIYWLMVTAMFLLLSFITNRWDTTWMIWPVAGVMFGVICIIAECIVKKK
ncbi:MAG: helix-turn-helix domain-containing protein [Clostridia bacterium]|nr:helix-turn-helix domain-containing protein [Clostridia bacterium]